MRIPFYKHLLSFLLLALFSFPYALKDESAPSVSPVLRPLQTLLPNASCKTVAEVLAAYTKVGSTLAKLRQRPSPIPAIYLTSLPKDLPNLKLDKRKEGFFASLLPAITWVNNEILAIRETLKALTNKTEHHLSREEKAWLAALKKEYRVKEKGVSSAIKELLHKVDVIPPSLALAQAYIETGGGQSSAARKKNSLFGHMDRNNRVRSFDSIVQSVQAYMATLNAHPAYKEFRNHRADLRKKGHLDPHRLADGLKKYSIRRERYTAQVKNIISSHNLHQFDKQLALGPSLTSEKQLAATARDNPISA